MSTVGVALVVLLHCTRHAHGAHHDDDDDSGKSEQTADDRWWNAAAIAKERAKTGQLDHGDAVPESQLPLKYTHNYHSYSRTKRSNSTINCFAERFDLSNVLRILSFGCASGLEVAILRKRFPHARIVGTDIVFDGSPAGRKLQLEAKLHHGGPRTQFATFDEAIALGNYDIISFNNVVYEHMDVDELDRFLTSLFDTFARPSAVLMMTSVLGTPDKLRRFALTPELRAKYNITKVTREYKLDGRVVLDWVRDRLLPLRMLAAEHKRLAQVRKDKADAAETRVAERIDARDHFANGTLRPEFLFRSLHHEIVTLDVIDGHDERDVKGNRLISLVVRPGFPLKRVPSSSPRWQYFAQRCVWNFHPSDLLADTPPHASGRAEDRDPRWVTHFA